MTERYSVPCPVFNIRNVCYPFLIGAICVKISIEKIGISMQIFTVIAVFLAPDDRKKVVFLHDTQYGLWILMDSLPFKPYMHPTVTISAVAVFLTRSDLLGKRKIPCGYIHSFDIVIVAAS